MEFIELQSVGEPGNLRFNLDALIGYSETTLYLRGMEDVILLPGTAKALDKLLKERVGCSILRVEAAEPPSED